MVVHHGVLYTVRRWDLQRVFRQRYLLRRIQGIQSFLVFLRHAPEAVHHAKRRDLLHHAPGKLRAARLPGKASAAAPGFQQRRLLAQAQELLRTIDGVQLLGAQEAPHILNLAVPGVRSQGLINALQERDIYVSAGSACSKGHRSHVLEAMGVDAAWIDGSVRVSLSDETTEDDIRALAEALPAVLTELRGGGRRA